MNRSFRVAAIAAVALGLAACSTTPSTTATAVAPAVPAAPARMAEPGQTTAPSARSAPTPAPTRAPVMALPAHQDPASAIYRERLVYEGANRLERTSIFQVRPTWRLVWEQSM